MKRIGKTIWLITLCLLVVGVQFVYASSVEEDEEKEKLDDWQYVPVVEEIDRAMYKGGGPPAGLLGASGSLVKSLGFSTGGAKDADNFFKNLENGNLPRYSSLTYEGLFYDYTFETGQLKKCESLFCPSYARGVSKDIYSGGTNYYLSVGLNSGLTEQNFERKKLNLVVVLDISGSMRSAFDAYYYDKPREAKASKEGFPKSKMEIANQSIVAMLDHLHPYDRFSMVLFDDRSFRAKPFRLVDKTDMEAISKHILDLMPRGGTNMAAGILKGVEQFTELQDDFKDPTVYENRIVFLTDAMPNRGELSKGGLFSMVKEASSRNIFTSFVGIGVDFNTDLIEHITKIRGANYYAVHSSEEFKKRLDDEFDFMVTPLVFNLELKLSSKDYEIDGVFGSPEADLATGQMMKINTLFPSSTEDEEVRGGVVLVKLRKTGQQNGTIQLNLSYDDRSGKNYTSSATAQFDLNGIHWDNKGIHKAVLLSDYVSLLKNWLIDSRKGCNDKVTAVQPYFPYLERGLIMPDFRPERTEMKTWEQRSCPLKVSEGYQKLFSIFSTHFATEMVQLDDSTLQKEMDVLVQLKGKNSGTKVDDWKIQQ